MRNFHQGFKHGLWAGLVHSGLQMVDAAAAACVDPMQPSRGYAEVHTLADHYGPGTTPRRASRASSPTARSPSTSVTDVYHSGTKHDEDQPVHLLVADTNVCETRCREEYGNPCEQFCPAAVYEMVPKGSDPTDGCACRSTSRTASTARPATSWTRTRSSPG